MLFTRQYIDRLKVPLPCLYEPLNGVYPWSKLASPCFAKSASPSKKTVLKIVYTAPGLSLNPSCRNPRKTVQFILKNFFPYRKDLVIWHDVLNNSISEHINNFISLSSQKLVQTLNQYSVSVKALVYCRRVGTKDIYRYLKVNFLTLNILKDIISKRKAKNKGLVGDYRALHQRHDLELKTLSVVLNNSSNLQRILAKSQPKRLNKR